MAVAYGRVLSVTPTGSVGIGRTAGVRRRGTANALRAAAGAAHKPSGLLQLSSSIVSSTRPLMTTATMQCRPLRMRAARRWNRGVATSAFGGDADPAASFDFDGLISGGYTPLLTEEDAEADAAQRHGLTLVHFSAELERFLWDRGCAQGLCSPC